MQNKFPTFLQKKKRYSYSNLKEIPHFSPEGKNTVTEV
jgi:hypothetical protein